MFKPSDIIIDEYLLRLREEFARAHPGLPSKYSQSLDRAGRLCLTHVARTNALYTNLDSTLLVAEVAMRILEGRQIERFDVSPEDWLHFMLAALAGYTGFVRGVVPGDNGRTLVISEDGETLELERSRTDGYLLRWYVVRSQMFVRENFRDDPIIDGMLVAEMLADCRLPIPRTPPKNPDSWGALLRASQTIALGADPRFVQRVKRIYRQLEEAGYTEQIGYTNAQDIIDSYPDLFWNHLLPQLPRALSYLKYTGAGQLWLARLNSLMLENEHRE